MYRICLAGLLDWLESVVFPKCCWYLELLIPFICLIHYFFLYFLVHLVFSLVKTTRQYTLLLFSLRECMCYLSSRLIRISTYGIISFSLSHPIFTCRHALLDYSLFISPNVYLHLILISSSNFVSYNQLVFPFQCMKIHQLKNLDYPHIFDDSGECSCRNNHIFRKNRCT